MTAEHNGRNFPLKVQVGEQQAEFETRQELECLEFKASHNKNHQIEVSQQGPGNK